MTPHMCFRSSSARFDIIQVTACTLHPALDCRSRARKLQQACVAVKQPVDASLLSSALRAWGDPGSFGDSGCHVQIFAVAEAFRAADDRQRHYYQAAAASHFARPRHRCRSLAVLNYASNRRTRARELASPSSATVHLTLAGGRRSSKCTLQLCILEQARKPLPCRKCSSSCRPDRSRLADLHHP